MLLLNSTWNQGKFCKLGLGCRNFRNVKAQESKAANSIRNAKIANYFSASISSGYKRSYSKQTHLCCRSLWSHAIQPLTNAPQRPVRGVKEELIKQGWTVFWKAPSSTEAADRSHERFAYRLGGLHSKDLHRGVKSDLPSEAMSQLNRQGLKGATSLNNTILIHKQNLKTKTC